MTGRRMGVIKAIGAFLLIMLGLTFFSRTLYYSTLPKVEAQGVLLGELQYRYEGTEFVVESPDERELRLNVDTGEIPLRVKRVYASTHAVVRAGDPILRFDEVIGEAAFEAAEHESMTRSTALTDWEHAYRSECNRLIHEQEAIRIKLREEGADVEGLQFSLDAAQADLNYLQQEQILNGTSGLQLERELFAAGERVNALSALRDQDWTIVATEDILIADMAVEIGSDYAGRRPLANVIPLDRPIRVGIKAPSLPGWFAKSGRVRIIPARSSEALEYIEAELRNGEWIIWSAYPDTKPDLSELGHLTIQYYSEQLEYLVPNSAIAGGQLFLLDTRLNTWGEEEYFVQAIDIQASLYDDRYTFINSGLYRDSMVVTSWDRPIRSGDAVAFSLK